MFDLVLLQMQKINIINKNIKISSLNERENRDLKTFLIYNS